MEKLIKIEGMSCSHCTSRVEKALKEISGITDVIVDLKTGTAKISALNDVDEKAISDAIYDAGFDVISIDLL
ncbi:MAG: heavy metal-associated domain-containing protein [Oscillospiraceae bacterium]